jgi:formylglycine-generating enzyme required for sulfatase activity
LKPNDLGLFDTLGNVLEWVDDPPRKSDRYREIDLESADGLVFTDRQDRHPRGGAFNYTADMLRSGCRFLNSDDYRQVTVGFRLARTLPEANR